MRSRWGVLISGNGSTLQSLLDSLDSIDVAVVIASKTTAYGRLRARRAGLPVEVLPEHLKGLSQKEAAEKWILETLAAYRVQNIFLAGYMKIVSPLFIQRYAGRIFNIHPSMLPRYRGLNSFQEALNAGDATAGVTVHHVAAEVDAGEFVIQREIEIPIHRDGDLSHLWLHINEQRLMRESLRQIVGSETLARAYRQKEALKESVLVDPPRVLFGVAESVTATPLPAAATSKVTSKVSIDE